VGASHAHLIAFMRELKVKLGASDDPSFIPDDDLPEVSIERGLSQVGGDETPERKTVALPPVKVPESLEPPASSESVAQPARRRKTTRRVALAAGGVALLVSVVLGVWAVPSLFAKPVVSRAVLDLAFEAPLSPPMECRTHDVAAVARIERALLSANVLDALLAEPVVDSAEYLALVARASLASGRPADAAAKHAVALCPSWALPHHLQGKAAQGLDHLDEAEGCYREAIRLLPDWDAPAFNLSLVLLAKPGAKGEAVTLLDGLIAKNPLDPKTHLLRGQAMLEAQRPKDAIADLEEALRLDPSEPTAKKLLETARRVR